MSAPRSKGRPWTSSVLAWAVVLTMGAACHRSPRPNDRWVDETATVTAVLAPDLPMRISTALRKAGLPIPTDLGEAETKALPAMAELVGLRADLSHLEGQDERQPVLVKLRTSTPANSAWPLLRLLRGAQSFADVDVPRLQVLVLLPARDAGGLARSLLAALTSSRICKASNNPGESDALSCELGNGGTGPVHLAVTAQRGAVAVGIDVGPADSADGHSGKPLPQAPASAQAIYAAQADLERDGAAMLVHARPSEIPALLAARYIFGFGDWRSQLPAEHVLLSEVNLLDLLTLFLPARSEIESIRASIAPEKPLPICAELTLSPNGVSVVTGSSHGQSNLGAALASVPAFDLGCVANSAVCEIPERVSTGDAFWGLLQAPLLFSKSLAGCMPAECRTPASLAASLGRHLGLDVQLHVDGPVSVRFTAHPQGVPLPLHGRIRLISPASGRVELGLSEPSAPTSLPPTISPTDQEPADMRGPICFEQGILHVRRILVALAADRCPSVGEEIASAQLAFECASGYPATTTVGRQWGEALALFIAQLNHQAFALDAQLSTLKRACEKGYALACKDIPHVEQLRAVNLPRSRCSCSEELSSCTPQPFAPWNPVLVAAMNANGRVEGPGRSRVVAIDARTPLRHLYAFLDSDISRDGVAGERGSSNAVSGKVAVQPGYFRSLALDERGRAVVLPLQSPPRSISCSEQVLHYRYTQERGRLRRTIRDLTQHCDFAGKPMNTSLLLEFPNSARWGSVLPEICEVACNFRPNGGDHPAATTPSLYLGTPPR